MFKRRSRKTRGKTVRRAVAKPARGASPRKATAHARKATKKNVSKPRTPKAKVRQTAKSTRRGRTKHKTLKLASKAKPAARASRAIRTKKKFGRTKARAATPTRKRIVTRRKPTADTIPPFFPTLDLPGEQLTESPPVFLEVAGERIEVPAVLLETEHPHSPASAGDGRLHVAARDPHWLYVYWDLTRDQQARLNAESNHGHLIVRIYPNSLNSEPATENHVHPQSRHWFTHVELPGGTYYAELGMYVDNEWRRVAVAGPVTTARRRFALDTTATYVTLHPDRPLAEQLEARLASEGEAGNLYEPEPAPTLNVSCANDWSPTQQLAVLCALGVIRAEELASAESGAETSGPAWQAAEQLTESGGPSSAGGGFGEAAASPNFLADLLATASSPEAAAFSLPEIPNLSS